MKNRTKWRFARELESMLHEMPLAKVQVKELCARCDERRQVFYYHFQDKYALVAWIYDQDYNAAEIDSESQDYQTLVVTMLGRLWEHREFYRWAFADKSQNSIERYIHEQNLEESKHMLLVHSGVKELTNEQRHAILFHSFGSVGTVVEWLRGNLKATTKELASWHCERMPSFLREAHEADVRTRLLRQ